MIKQFFSRESAKAWVGGVLAALLTPVFQLLTSDADLSVRTVLVALVSGVLAAVAIYSTTNGSTDPPGNHAA